MGSYTKIHSDEHDNDCEHECEKNEKELWSCQNTLVLLSFLGISIGYTMRGNLSVTIVAIVRKNASHSVLGTAEEDIVCPYDKTYNHSKNSLEGEFSWSESEKGYILGASLFGLVISNSVGGMAAEKYGGKVILGIGLLLSSILTIVTPFVIRYSAIFFVVLRFLVGVAEGLISPAVTPLITSWTLPEERSRACGSIHSGADFGTLAILPLSGVLIASPYFGGWPSVFYVSGGIGVIWSLFWFTLIYDSPEKHPRLSQWEKQKLLSVPPFESTDIKNIPFKKIFSSIHFYGLVAMHMGTNWGFYTLFTELPNFFAQIHHMDIFKNGIVSSVPYALAWIVAIAFSTFMTKLSFEKKISILNVRRFSMILAGYVPAMGFIALCFVGCSEYLAVALLCFSLGLTGCHYSGFACTSMDLSPRYAGTIAGIDCAISNTVSFISPVVTGYILEHNSLMTGWQSVFLLTSAMFAFTTTIYLATVTDKIQPWNEVTTATKC